MAVYRGFSTINRNSPPYLVTDIELVKIDLMNEFNTRRGERFMLPNFGTIIHELIMDPLDELTVDAIENDVVEIIRREPRVELIDDPVITESDRTVRVEVELFFNGQDSAEHLIIDFERNIEESR